MLMPISDKSRFVHGVFSRVTNIVYEAVLEAGLFFNAIVATASRFLLANTVFATITILWYGRKSLRRNHHLQSKGHKGTPRNERHTPFEIGYSLCSPSCKARCHAT